MMRITDIRKLKPLNSSLENPSYQFLQRCSVSGTAKRQRKIQRWTNTKAIENLHKKKGTMQPDPAAKSGGGARRSEMEQMVDECIRSSAPVRFLKPKEREREAKREKMGLLNEARKLEIQKLKKPQKTDNKPSIIGTPGLDLISLGLVDASEIPNYELSVEDGRKLAKEYSRVLIRKHRVRQAAESNLLRCDKEAIESLPDDLKATAFVPDLSTFPVNRFMATLTPPIEGYLDKINEAAKRSAGKRKLR